MAFGNGPSLLDQEVLLREDIEGASTPQLVRAYTEIKVRYALHAARTPHFAGHFGPLGLVVDELRRRSVLD